jgi:hypothetical protein
VRSDRVSKPTRSRVFVRTHEELIELVKAQQFWVYSHHQRLPIFLENCEYECPAGLQLASFNHAGYLAVFSLPEDINVKVAGIALERAIEEFGRIDKKAHPSVRRQQIVVYRAYLQKPARLTVTQDIVNAGSRSYLVYKTVAQISKSQKEAANERVLLELDTANL